MKIPPGVAEFFSRGTAGRQTDRQTDRHDEANSRNSKFCKCAKKNGRCK